MRVDDFTPKIKRLLAARVGHVCSNPDCRAPTSGPQLDNDKAVIAGDAAHITAASPNGPRFDSEFTSEERRHYNNGIWLCANDARIVDQDKSRYTVELLRQWKSEAEAEAKRRLARPSVHRGPSPAAIAFSKHAKSIIAALSTYHESSSMLGIEGHLAQTVFAAESLGIPVPIEIQTLPYPNGVVAGNPFLQDRFEGSCIIRFPDGSWESGRVAHASGLQLLVESRDSAIVALEQWLIQLNVEDSAA